MAGETVEITAVLHSHGLAAETHLGVYRLKTAAGEDFLGDLLWCKVKVMENKLPLSVTAEQLEGVRNMSNPSSSILTSGPMSDFGTMDGASDGKSEEEYIVVHPSTGADETASQSLQSDPVDFASTMTNEGDQQQQQQMLVVENPAPSSLWEVESSTSTF